MATITFDTLEYASKLKAAGFSEPQAEALARVQKESLSEALDTTLATKGDIEEIKGELRLIRWMLALVIAVTVLPALKTLFGLLQLRGG